MREHQRKWAKAHGFRYSRASGWTRPDGLRITWSGGWVVMTPGCGFHPSLRIPD